MKFKSPAKALLTSVANHELHPKNSVGFLDVLSGNPARAAGENPAIVFMTTSDVRKISKKTVAEASSRRIGIWHSIGSGLTQLAQRTGR